ncbi:TPA: hypothetical protein ACX3KD_005627, partial [Raoultella ornithinolytica]
MTSKFTREELLNIIETDHVQCGEASALASMALAAMDSEPVGTFRKTAVGYTPSYHEDAVALYRHAQPAPVVPDSLLNMAASAIEDLLEHTDPNTSYYSGVWADVP